MVCVSHLTVSLCRPGQVHRGGVICELCCAALQPAQLLSHLRDQHPGCGRAADTRGYLLSGVYAEEAAARPQPCGTATDACYLLCAGCRERQLLTAAHRWGARWPWTDSQLRIDGVVVVACVVIHPF